MPAPGVYLPTTIENKLLTTLHKLIMKAPKNLMIHLPCIQTGKAQPTGEPSTLIHIQLYTIRFAQLCHNYLIINGSHATNNIRLYWN